MENTPSENVPSRLKGKVKIQIEIACSRSPKGSKLLLFRRICRVSGKEHEIKKFSPLNKMAEHVSNVSCHLKSLS